VPSLKRHLRVAVADAPLGIVIVAAALVASGTITAAADLFTPWVTLPLAAVLAACGWWLIPRTQLPGRSETIAVAVALLAAAVWVGIQVNWPTEFLRPSRDPGIYTLTGIWLAEHGTPSIDVSRAVHLAAGDPLLDAVLGFDYEPDLAIHLQGGDSAPSIVGYGWWLAGLEGALRANIVMGGVALLAVFELGRRVLRSAVLALIPLVLLGASLPMINFARAPYTETAAVAFFAVAASVLVGAFRASSARGFLLAGVLAGTASMTRIDTALGLAAMMAAFALVGLGVAAPPTRIPLLRAFLLFAAGGAVFAGLGTADLLTNYARYVSDLGSQVALLWALLAGVSIFTLVLLGWRHRSITRGRGWISPWTPRVRRRWGLAISGIVIALMVFWVTRPFWMAYHQTSELGYQIHVAGLQAAAGVENDPTRSYDEYSLWWFAWYFGWPMLALVAVGLVLLFRRAVVGQDAGVLAFLSLSGGVALLYLNLISIAPDQVWAFRRVLPVITPAFLIAAAAVVGALWGARRRRWLARAGAVLAVAALLLGVRTSWNPSLFNDVEFGGQLSETTRLCALVDEYDIVVVSDVSSGLGLTLRVVCGADVLTLADGDPDERRESLAALVDEGLEPVVVTENPDGVAWNGQTPEATVVQPITRWDNRLFDSPRLSGTSERSTWVASVEADGALRP